MLVERLEPRLCLAALVAFPGAEGFGRFAQGGRGGDVYHVQNLNNDGPGSFREGINTANGPRTVVFDVTGTIFLESDININKPYITIAGETAPGGGITFAGDRFQIIATHDVIVRYIRSRPGDILGNTQAPESRDSFNVFKSTDVILDHVSGSWSTDEVLAFTGPGNVTIQWSIASEALNESFHPKGSHSDGFLNVDGNISLHHNLFVSDNSRNPKVTQSADVVNNVVYNFGIGAPVGVFGGDDPIGPTQVNFDSNYYIAGPDTSSGSISLKRMVRLFEEAEIWTKDNFVDFNRNGILDGILATDANIEFHDSDASPEGIVVAHRFDYPQVTTTDAPTAYDQVLRRAGASLVRDDVDLRIVDEVMNQTGQNIDSQDEVGSWPILASGETPLDSDQDGMPDDWENSHNLDPQDPADRNLDDDGNGYTELEEYLHALASGVSDQTAPTVTVNAPNGAETWDIGSVQNITWSASDNVGVTAVDRYYSNSGAAGPFNTIALGEGNDGLFSWTVPNDPTDNAFVRVIAHDAGGNTAEHFSGLAFTINNQPPQTITLHVADGWDQKGEVALVQDETTSPRQVSDNDWLNVKSKIYTPFRFASPVPVAATIQSVVIYGEYREEADMLLANPIVWEVGGGNLVTPSIVAAMNPPLFIEENSEATTSWDVTPWIDTRTKAIDSKFVVRNNDPVGKK